MSHFQSCYDSETLTGNCLRKAWMCCVCPSLPCVPLGRGCGGTASPGSPWDTSDHTEISFLHPKVVGGGRSPQAGLCCVCEAAAPLKAPVTSLQCLAVLWFPTLPSVALWKESVCTNNSRCVWKSLISQPELSNGSEQRSNLTSAVRNPADGFVRAAGPAREGWGSRAGVVSAFTAGTGQKPKHQEHRAQQ